MAYLCLMAYKLVLFLHSSFNSVVCIELLYKFFFSSRSITYGLCQHFLVQKPIRRGVVGYTLTVEELGRRKLNGGVSPVSLCFRILFFFFLICKLRKYIICA